MNSKCKKILWISPYMPYDKVTHAGGKCHNYYIKYFKKKLNCKIDLLTFAYKKESVYFDLNDYEISYKCILKDKNWFTIFIRKLMNIESICNPFHRFGGGISNYMFYGFQKMIKRYYDENKDNPPDVIVMQWTQAGFMINYLKKSFPNSLYIIIEEDVSFQGKLRKLEFTSNLLLKTFRQLRFNIYKQSELKILNFANIVTVNNYKDKALLEKEKICLDKIVQIAPYFDNMANLNTEERNKNILFYGAMNRQENYLSAIWFIENVFYQLADSKLEFLIIGGNPNYNLSAYESERVHVIGYVEDIGDYFKNSLCLVAPLLLGAGIKIKVLEALSAGLPVVTNEIGAEGIGIIDEISYLHCNKPSDYITAIDRLSRDADLQKRIGNNGRQYIIDNFNIDKTLDNLIDKMINYR